MSKQLDAFEKACTVSHFYIVMRLLLKPPVSITVFQIEFHHTVGSSRTVCPSYGYGKQVGKPHPHQSVFGLQCSI